VKLRTQIFLFLFLLGLAPLAVSVIINVPLVLDRLELFYHKAYLQKLRADFFELDQHMIRRQETVRLFAKLPEPAIGMSSTDSENADKLAQLRAAYTEWSNRILFDQLDIIQLNFVEKEGNVSFSLNRDPETGLLTSGSHTPNLPAADFIAEGLRLGPGAVLTGPISFQPGTGASSHDRFMTLRFISPLLTPSASGGAPELHGAVIVNLDVGGLARAYHGLFWAQNNGEYLSQDDDEIPASNAFTDFPGLAAIFAKGELALWTHGKQQIFWIPLFMIEGSGPLWVGRSVDPSPIENFRRTLEIRVISIATVLLLVVFMVARLIAVRTERVSRELTDGISGLLERDEAVSFRWKRPEVLRSLGDNLSRLAEKHAQDAQALRSHAKALEESNRYKSEFLANVSHELRTPLNSILLLSKMLANNAGKLPDEQTQQARVIHDAGNDLRALIDTILDLSRIEAGKVRIKAEAVKLRDLLDNLVDLMRPQFEEKGLQLELHIDHEAPASLVTDHEKLRQILVNFLSNALKFTEQGKIVLKLARNHGNNARALPVAISVTDSGIGIPADEQELVFEAFRQVDGSTSRRHGGTGLGLTISRQLARLIAGRIQIESQVGIGSTFTLLLPMAISADTSMGTREPAAADTTKGRQPAGIPAAHYAGKRVLLVDDDMRNLLALTPLLESWGIEVTAAGEGQEALDTLRDDRAFDLVLLDLMMPGMDGYETMERIRADHELGALPVVVLTARAAEEDRNRAMARGANDFLSKPVEPAALKAMLDRHLLHNTGPSGITDSQRAET